MYKLFTMDNTGAMDIEDVGTMEGIYDKIKFILDNAFSPSGDPNYVLLFSVSRKEAVPGLRLPPEEGAQS